MKGLCILVWIVFYPLVSIWAINDLFHTGIEYNFSNWISIFILGMIIGNLR